MLFALKWLTWVHALANTHLNSCYCSLNCLGFLDLRFSLYSCACVGTEYLIHMHHSKQDRINNEYWTDLGTWNSVPEILAEHQTGVITCYASPLLKRCDCWPASHSCWRCSCKLVWLLACYLWFMLGLPAGRLGLSRSNERGWQKQNAYGCDMNNATSQLNKLLKLPAKNTCCNYEIYTPFPALPVTNR